MTEKKKTGSDEFKISRSGDWNSPVQAAKVQSLDIIEIYLCIRPDRETRLFSDQARSIYDTLSKELLILGLETTNIISEKIFFSDIESQIPEIMNLRKKFYQNKERNDENLPPATYIQEPPAIPGHLCELRAYAMVPSPASRVSIRSFKDMKSDASGKIVQHDNIRHLFLSNVTGGFANDGLDFFSQASSMFENTENLLEKEGFSFSNTVRTWLYLKDIHRDYDTLNLIRRNFFDSRKIYPYPASTGIQGISYPSDRLCQLDLYGISSDDRIELHPIYASTMIEAPVYGSYFSRGIRIDFPDKKVIYLSGTASIDPEGCVMHVGNISGQVERMLQNVKDLLKSQGATFDDLVSSVTYLKRSEYFEPFVKICGQCGFDRKIPNTICVADVCRPEWLCEIEAIAVLKK